MPARSTSSTATAITTTTAGRRRQHVVSGGGGAWADCNSDTHIDGASANGIRYAGTCMINCTTDNEVYSFHPGGANVCFADGSVHFVKESINPAVFFALITRAGGEIISADQY